MTYRRPSGAAAALMMALVVPLPIAPATAEDSHIELLWPEPISSAHPAVPAGTDRAPALLSLPPGWRPGDAAAIVAGDGPGIEESRRRVIAALLREGAAVLELGPAFERNRPSEARSGRTVQSLLPGFLGALLALRRDAGAGLVVALGYGTSGQAALLATRDDIVAGHLGRGGPRFAASAALGPERPAFIAGATPAPEENWPMRAPLLCAALAWANMSGPAETLERDCVTSLLPSAADPPLR